MPARLSKTGSFVVASHTRRVVGTISRILGLSFTRAIDPWAHPLTVHDQGSFQSAQDVASQLHVDFVTLQFGAGRCGDALVANRFVQRYAGNVPVYAQEVCWEATSKLNADQVRKGAWGVLLTGAFLNYAEMFEGPNFGKPENYGDGKALPYLEIMFDFLAVLPSAEMRAHNELVNQGRICRAKPGSHYICYSPTGGMIELDQCAAALVACVIRSPFQTGDHHALTICPMPSSCGLAANDLLRPLGTSGEGLRFQVPNVQFLVNNNRCRDNGSSITQRDSK